MTTVRALALLALGPTRERPVDPSDLSLALAGAEVIDLLGHGALTLDDDRMVPAPPVSTGDRLLDLAAASLTRDEPYETVEQWLWRRGVDLAPAYADDLEKAGLVPGRRGWLGGPRRKGAARTSSETDSVSLPTADESSAAREAALGVLTALLRIGEETPTVDENVLGDGVMTVLAAVGDAVTHLEALRLRRGVENDAFDNIWRG
ncbi:GPP34 family phosphoprotein [Streptomyces sp. VRA16 Mangrove soil]|uniref:GOLPH3/VPS74 family protein n=1 Tax=Streptomyces sp. VRA16 Mangrove soil TaxID=2817434 RepID=UPI001A9FAC7D|nr:GPP34 family phosphoprotein [Streptomyces sp. VRA16 Mangrove soil]